MSFHANQEIEKHSFGKGNDFQKMPNVGDEEVRPCEKRLLSRQTEAEPLLLELAANLWSSISRCHRVQPGTGAIEAAFHVSEGNFFSDPFAAGGACDPANFLPGR